MNDAFHTRQTLLQRVKAQRDEKSWEEFVHYYRHYIYIICRRMNLGHHDAEEVVQLIIVKLWKKLPEFNYDSRSRFRSWLCTVTGNAVRDFVRGLQSMKRKHDNASVEQEYKVNIPDIEKIAEEEWQNYISTLALEKVRQQYSPQVVEIFLKLNEGKSRTELAEEYQLPANTISVYKKRILHALCKEIRLLEDDLS